MYVTHKVAMKFTLNILEIFRSSLSFALIIITWQIMILLSCVKTFYITVSEVSVFDFLSLIIFIVNYVTQQLSMTKCEIINQSN